MTALHITVEISDQYGTVQTLFLGVYDDLKFMEKVKQQAEHLYRRRRTYFTETPVSINQSIMPRVERLLGE